MNQQNFERILHHYQDTKYNPNRDTLHRRVKDAYPILKQHAADRNLIAYKPLADQIGTDERKYLSVVLGTISRMEDLEGRPPLSAVAVQKNARIPNQEFFNLVENLQYTPPRDSTEGVFEYIRDDLASEWG